MCLMIPNIPAKSIASLLCNPQALEVPSSGAPVAMDNIIHAPFVKALLTYMTNM